MGTSVLARNAISLTEIPSSLTSQRPNASTNTLFGGGSAAPRAHRFLVVPEVDLELPHGADDGDHRLDGVGEDDRSVLQTLLLRVPLLVDDSETDERFGYTEGSGG